MKLRWIAPCLLLFGTLAFGVQAQTDAPTSPQGPPSIPTAAPTAVSAYPELAAKSAGLTPAEHAQANGLFSTAFGLWKSGDFAAAEIGFKNGLAIDPANAPANYYYGDCLVRRKDKVEAKGYLARAVAFGGMTAEGLRAQAELQALMNAPIDVADMTPEQVKTAFLGTWEYEFKWRTYEFTGSFSVTSVNGNETKVIGDNYIRVSSASVLGSNITIVERNFLAPDNVLKGRLTTTTHIEGQRLGGDGEAFKFSADKVQPAP